MRSTSAWAEAEDVQTANRRVGALRRKLPTGRVVTGGALMAAAAVLVFTVALENTQSHGKPYVVVTRPLAAGTVLSAGDLATATMRLPPGASADSFGAVAIVEGRTLAADALPGELVESSMLEPTSSNPASRPVSIAVDATSLTGLLPGQRVDVLAVSGGSDSGSAGAGSQASVTVVMRGATLISASTATANPAAGSSDDDVTLGVSTLGEVEAVVSAAQSGTVTLVTAEPSDGVGPGPGGSEGTGSSGP